MLSFEILVLRHGETEWNRLGILQGGMDSELTEVGQRHARRQSEILGAMALTGFDWFCSPQGRAVETAKLIAPQLDFREDERLVEIRMGQWTGKSRAEIQALNPQLFEGDDSLDWYAYAPDGEGFLSLETRCRSFLNSLKRPAVIVTHGITSRFIRCLALGWTTDHFTEVGGGQGVVYQIKNGEQAKLDLQA